MTITLTRRAQIQAVAETLFRDRGYLATSMRDIADEMQMKGGSLYAHIQSKEELLLTIAHQAADVFFAALLPISTLTIAPEAKLQAAMIAHVQVITTHLNAAAVYFDEWRHLSQPERDRFAARRDEYEAIFQGILHEGIASQRLRAVDERLTTLHLLSSLNAVRHWYRHNGRLSATAVAESLADMLMLGLRC
jgi:TetR/AcrR family transcriptional regulator, cholesterol catabolism regulator